MALVSSIKLSNTNFNQIRCNLHLNKQQPSFLGQEYNPNTQNKPDWSQKKKRFMELALGALSIIAIWGIWSHFAHRASIKG